MESTGEVGRGDTEPLAERLGISDTSDTPEIAKLDVGVRSYKVLRDGGIDTLDQLCSCSEFDLRFVRNCGIFTIMEIQTALESVGRSLRIPPIPTIRKRPDQVEYRAELKQMKEFRRWKNENKRR